MLLNSDDRFAALNRLITKDVMRYRRHHPAFHSICKKDIQRYLDNPRKYRRELRHAVQYIYDASPHFKRLIWYFVGLNDFDYVVSPYRIDPTKAKKSSVKRNYHKVLNTMSAFNAASQFPKILSVCLREDIFFGTIWATSDSISIQQLPSDFCDVRVIEGNVFNVSFNFHYFDLHPNMLDWFPEEFRIKYELYKQTDEYRLADPMSPFYEGHVWKDYWIELDCPTSFAVKCSDDIDYPMPPFAGILREVYDLEDYKNLKLSKTALENYAMLWMKIPLTEDGDWGIDLNKAREFWFNLDAVLPDEIGSVLTPMPIEKISFERSNNGEDDTIQEAEQNLFTAAGVSSLLFNNAKASANALALSIKSDQNITYRIVKNIGMAVNRYIQAQSYGKNFVVNFLDISTYNRKEAGDAYLKACQYGMPMVSYYCASQGLGQAEMECMNFLEDDVLEIKDKFIPLMNSSNMSKDAWESEAPTDEGGRPALEDTELTDSGEQTRADSSDWG